MSQIVDAQAALSVKFAEGGKACVVFQAGPGHGPRGGSVPTLVGALLASALARMGNGAKSAELLGTVDRAAAAFASMRQPNILPAGMQLVEASEVDEGQAVCTMLIPADGSDFLRGLFASDDPDVAYKAFLYSLQWAVDSLPPESLVSLASVLRSVSDHFRSSIQWPDTATVERELAAGKAGVTRS